MAQASRATAKGSLSVPANAIAWWIRESAQPRRPGEDLVSCGVAQDVAHAAEHPVLAALVNVSAAVS